MLKTKKCEILKTDLVQFDLEKWKLEEKSQLSATIGVCHTNSDGIQKTNLVYHLRENRIHVNNFNAVPE